jgi:outer membrane lipoprotein-sorting protein
MKYSILAVAAIFCALVAQADGKSDAIVAALHKKVASWGDYRIEFAVTIDGESVKGSFEVSGAKYRVVTPAMDIFCDGTTRWDVNNIDSEVVIDRVYPSDRTVMGNPTQLFDFVDGAYTHCYVGPAMVNGVNCDRIEIREKSAASAKNGRADAVTTKGSPGRSGSASASNKGGSAQTIDLFVATATGMPVRVGYTVGLMSAEVAVDVVKVSPRVMLAPATFSYDAKRYTGYEVIDFR